MPLPIHTLSVLSRSPKSPVVLLTLAVILLASTWVFFEHVRRQTTLRRRLALFHWARARQLKIIDPPPGDSQAFEPLSEIRGKIEKLISGETISIAMISTDDSRETPAKTPIGKSRWNVLLRAIPSDWPPSGLRPTAGASSLLDLYPLSSFPSLAAGRRFMIFGTESRAAAILAKSASDGLMPPDVGLLLSGRYLILDFSTRPFDEIEFERMIELSGQLAERLGNLAMQSSSATI
jgi:hypothetical protein